MLRHACPSRVAVWGAVLFQILVAMVLTVPAGAQRLVIEPVRPVPIAPPPTVLPPSMGAPGLGGVLQQLPSAPTLAPLPAPPVAVPAPAAPARIIRFRCELAPQSEVCAEPGSADGGGDEECNCARDRCYVTPNGARFCEKLQ